MRYWLTGLAHAHALSPRVGGLRHMSQRKSDLSVSSSPAMLCDMLTVSSDTIAVKTIYAYTPSYHPDLRPGPSAISSPLLYQRRSLSLSLDLATLIQTKPPTWSYNSGRNRRTSSNGNGTRIPVRNPTVTIRYVCLFIYLFEVLFVVDSVTTDLPLATSCPRCKFGCDGSV